MNELIVSMICDGDYENQKILRSWFDIEDMLVIEKKKTPRGANIKTHIPSLA